MDSSIASAWRKFFSPKDEVLRHWYSSVDKFQFVSAEFYQMIEGELAVRKVPSLEIARVEFSEGGMLSDKREYLRLKRERLVFDICAAPFGTSYFFSFRFVQLPLGIKPWELLIFLVGLALGLELLTKLVGVINGVFWFIVIVGAGIYFMRNAVALGLRNLDANLLKTPVIGPIYEVVFRKETYYREDTRLMYLSTVNSITEALIDEITAAKGVKLVRRFDRTQINGELYKERPNPTDKRSEPTLDKAA